MNQLCALVTAELGIDWDRTQRATMGELITWARAIMERWARNGAEAEKLQWYFEELVEGADYGSRWAALEMMNKKKSGGGNGRPWKAGR